MGAVFGAQAALLFHHLELFAKVVIAPLVVGKTVGLQRHHIRQTVAWYLLEIAGVVLAGESVFTPAQSGNTARKIARFDAWRSFEKHVLQEMGHPGGAIDLVHRAHPHPQHVHRRGRTVVGLHNQRHSVGKCELFYRIWRGVGHRNGQEQRKA